jgi:hypothetical protein
MAESSHPVAQFEKNSKEEIRVSIDDFRGTKLINIRVFYRSATGEWLPGKQGIAMKADLYRDLASAILQLGEALQEQGLLPAIASSNAKGEGERKKR